MHKYTEIGTVNHSGRDCRYEGLPLDELRNYFDWLEEAKEYCDTHCLEKGAYFAVGHIFQQY